MAARRYRWTGREYDVETGWYFFRGRYYDPASQRFVQEDPIGYEGSSNLYSYGEGNPTNGTDPYGRKMKKAPDGGGPTIGFCLICGGGGNQVLLDGVRVHESFINALPRNSYEAIYGGPGRLTLWDWMTGVEREYTGKITFPTEEGRDLYRSLKKQAYTAGRLALIAVLDAAERAEGISIWAIPGIAFPGCSPSCSVGRAIAVFTDEGPLYGVRNEVWLGHEIGHLIPRPAGLPYSTVPGASAVPDEYWSCPPSVDG
jgi:RHS repeat-associated protein